MKQSFPDMKYFGQYKHSLHEELTSLSSLNYDLSGVRFVCNFYCTALYAILQAVKTLIQVLQVLDKRESKFNQELAQMGYQ